MKMTKYKIETGAWFTYYKKVEFVVESETEPKIVDEHDVLDLWEKRSETLKIDSDPTTEEVEWVDMDKLKINELQ